LHLLVILIVTRIEEARNEKPKVYLKFLNVVMSFPIQHSLCLSFDTIELGLQTVH